MSLCSVHCTVHHPLVFFTSQHYFFAVTSVPCIYSRVFQPIVHFCVNASYCRSRCLYPCLHCCYFHTLLGLINDFRNGCCSTFTICGPRVWKLISIYQKCTNAYLPYKLLCPVPFFCNSLARRLGMCRRDNIKHDNKQQKVTFCHLFL